MNDSLAKANICNALFRIKSKVEDCQDEEGETVDNGFIAHQQTYDNNTFSVDIIVNIKRFVHCMLWYPPVSYTHLDVYKRQP